MYETTPGIDGDSSCLKLLRRTPVNPMWALRTWCASLGAAVACASGADTGPLVVGEGFHGSIDEVWAYNRPLNGVEICMAVIA